LLKGIPNGMTYLLRDKLLETKEAVTQFLSTKSAAKRALLEETGLWAEIEKRVDERLEQLRQKGKFKSDAAFKAAKKRELAIEFKRPIEVVLTRLDAHQKGLGFYMDPAFGIEGMMKRSPER